MSFAFSVLFAIMPSSLLIASSTVALLHDHPCFSAFFAILSVILYPNVKQDPGHDADKALDKIAEIQKNCQEKEA